MIKTEAQKNASVDLFSELLNLASKLRWELHGFVELHDERGVFSSQAHDLMQRFDEFCEKNNLTTAE